MPESPGVLLPGDSAPGLCQLALVTCSGYTLVSRQPSSETTTTSCLTQGCPFLCVISCQTLAVDMSDVERVSGAAMRRREAPAALVAEARAADRAHGPCRDFPPLPQQRLRRSSRRSGWEGTRSTPPYGDRTRQGPGRPRTARRRPVWPGIRRSSRCTMRKTPCGVRGLPGAHRGAACRARSHGTDSRPSCAADAGTAVEQVIDMPKIILDQVSQRSAAGGTVGGSASALLLRVLSRAQRGRGGDHGTGQGRCWSHVVPRSWTTWGLLVDARHAPHPVAAAGGTHRRPRAFYKYWARLRLCAPLWTSL